MDTQQRAILITLSVVATASIFAGALIAFPAMMHWLDRHPGAVTALRVIPLLSIFLLAWANYHRQKRQTKS